MSYPTPEGSAIFFQHQPDSYVAEATTEDTGAQVTPTELDKDSPWAKPKLCSSCAPYTNS